MGIDPWQMVENAKIRTDYRLKSYYNRKSVNGIDPFYDVSLGNLRS